MALDLTDYSPNGNNLTNSNVSESSDVPSGLAGCTVSAAIVRAESDWLYITDANQTGLDFSTTFTVEFWAKFTTVNNFSFIIAKDNDSAVNRRSYWISINVSKLNCWVAKGDGTFDGYYYNALLQAGTWNHWAVTFNVGNASATTMEFFKDGVSVGNGSADIANDISSINDSDATFTIGDRAGSGTTGEGSRLDGLLTDIRMWNDVRTAQEIADNYGIRLTGNEANLVGYWPFEGLADPASSTPPLFRRGLQGLQSLQRLG